MHSCQEDSIGIQKRFRFLHCLFLQQFSLSPIETAIVVIVKASDAPVRDGFQSVEEFVSTDNQRRENLFEYVAVVLNQQAKELADFMTDQVNFGSVFDAAVVDRFIWRGQSHHLAQWKQVTAAKINVAVGRWETIDVRAAYGHE